MRAVRVHPGSGKDLSRWEKRRVIITVEMEKVENFSTFEEKKGLLGSSEPRFARMNQTCAFRRKVGDRPVLPVTSGSILWFRHTF